MEPQRGGKGEPGTTAAPAGPGNPSRREQVRGRGEDAKKGQLTDTSGGLTAMELGFKYS